MIVHLSLATAIDVAGALALGSLLLGVYAQGIRVSRRRRGPTPTRAASWAYTAGVVTMVVALWPAVDALAAERFSWHMGQHLLLLVVAAPLLAAGRPELAWGPWLPASVRERLPVLNPSIARRSIGGGLLLSTALLWAWHVPVLFDVALGSEPVHVAEHLCLLASGLLFWWPILSADVRRAAGEGAALLALVAGGVMSSVLGALMAFASSPWYPAYRAVELANGIKPLADQQVAGMLMWVPPSVVQLGVAAWLFITWLDRDERESRNVAPVGLGAGAAGYASVPGRTSR